MTTFKEKYEFETIWYKKVFIIEIYHLARCSIPTGKKWTIRDTARMLNVSVGLISENLKIARAIHSDEKLLECNNRQEALDRIK